MQSQSKASILIVDDTETNVDVLVELLDEKYEVLVALDGLSALELLEEQKVDLILLDIMMPYMDGYEVCSKIKENKKTENIPVIFITAKTDEASIEKAYEVGGIDYVTKPFKTKELFARIATQLKLQKLIKDLEASKNKLRHLSETDPMTSLCNRRYFSQASQAILALAKRDYSELSLIILDIDKFKYVNDTYGHQVGDDVIIALSKVLLEVTRKSDLACRFGGEEFILLLPETSQEGAVVIAEKIRKSIASLLIETKRAEKVKVTVSLGVSQVDLLHDSSIEATIKRADDALYEAKETGRNKVVQSR